MQLLIVVWSAEQGCLANNEVLYNVSAAWDHVNLDADEEGKPQLYQKTTTQHIQANPAL